MIKVLQLICSAFFLLGLAAEDEMDLKVTVEKIEIVAVNKDYITEPKVVVFQYNATHQAINCSGKLLKDIGMDLKDNVDVYGVESDGPHLMTTARDINVCDILSGDFPELEELFKFGNFTKCPMKAGFYVISNAVVDTSKIPPSAPRGDFILDIKSYDGETEISNGKLYLKIEDIPAKKKN